jgi:drug/metabolite transporter (DMT)-like permease
MLMVLLGTAGTLWLKPGGLGGGTAGGVALSIGAGLLYAAYALGVRKWMHGMPSLPAFAVVSQYTGAVILVLMLIFGERHGAPALDLPGREFFYLVLSAVIGIGLGHTLYYASIARLGLAVSAGVVQLQPITVSIGSFFLFGEKLTTGQWVFGMVAVLGAGVMLWAQHRTARAARIAAASPEAS